MPGEKANVKTRLAKRVGRMITATYNPSRRHRVLQQDLANHSQQRNPGSESWSLKYRSGALHDNCGRITVTKLLTGDRYNVLGDISSLLP